MTFMNKQGREFGERHVRFEEKVLFFLAYDLEVFAVLKIEFVTNIDAPVDDTFDECVAGAKFVHREENLDLPARLFLEKETGGKYLCIVKDHECMFWHIVRHIFENFERHRVSSRIIYKESRAIAR